MKNRVLREAVSFNKGADALAERSGKELFVIEGATHIALYDIPKYVDQAVSKLVSFFGARL